VLFITGTRADFGKLKPLIKAVDDSGRFECHIFATGMHTLRRYGSTHDEIRKTGFRNIFLFMNQFADGGSAMDITLANTITGLAHYVREFEPDLIIVHGDRIEALAGAIVGTTNNVLVAHLEGGEVSGTLDEVLRHAITKLAHLHFVANDEARRRIIQLGECDSSVFVVGSADIDVMLSDELPTLAEARRHYEIDFDRYCLFLYHPVTTEIERLRRNARVVCDALIASGRNFVVIYPNNDPGADAILEETRPLADCVRFRLFPSVRFEHFLTLLKHADAIVGNSSAGIREAPVYGVPTINVGTRQRNRFHFPSIVNVPEDSAAILNALQRLPVGVGRSLHFGDGRCASRFLAIMNSPQPWRTPRQKQFRDLPDEIARPSRSERVQVTSACP